MRDLPRLSRCLLATGLLALLDPGAAAEYWSPQLPHPAAAEPPIPAPRLVPLVVRAPAGAMMPAEPVIA